MHLADGGDDLRYRALAPLADRTAYLQPGFDDPALYAIFDRGTISPASSETAGTGAQHAPRPTPPPTPLRLPPLAAPKRHGKQPDPGARRRGTKPVQQLQQQQKKEKKVTRVGPGAEGCRADVMTGGDGGCDGDGDGDRDKAAAGRPRRVRTGCLTCRERHLKCDEAAPRCHNCTKSDRACKRGMRLNFIDMWVEQPPRIVTRYGTDGWTVAFLDESRDIASEYQGGRELYDALDLPAPAAVPSAPSLEFDFAATAVPPGVSVVRELLPHLHGILPEPSSHQNPQQQQRGVSGMYYQPAEPDLHRYPLPQLSSESTSDVYYGGSGAPSTNGPASAAAYETPLTDAQDQDAEKKEYIDNPEETLLMQIFVEEVAIWMDSMDQDKHFSRLLPFQALSEPMLLNAFLACGARHLNLVKPAFAEEKALHYYDTATRHLLNNLQNPNRDTSICATTAVILNVYELMSEHALQRMNHIAGARALIKECGWNARSSGIGAACFWLNVGLEVLSCLHFNWQPAWDPDLWGLDMDLSRETRSGREEVWTHRMFYIIAKLSTFRATVARSADLDPRAQQIHTQRRFDEWSKLKALLNAWNDGIPRTMRPLAFLHPHQTHSKSCFPEVWLPKRSSIVAKLLFHTGELLMAEVHPYRGPDNSEVAEQQRPHAQVICGIAAHVKDRGVASVAIRSLAHAAETLEDRRAQEEVLQIFKKIHKETGWRVDFLFTELKDKWGWNEDIRPEPFAHTQLGARLQQDAHHQHRQLRQQMQVAEHMPFQQNLSTFGTQQQQPLGVQPPAFPLDSMPPPQTTYLTPPQQPTPTERPPAGIPNPMYKEADFNMSQHPYQNVYVAPNTFGNYHGGGLYYTPH